MKRLFTALAVGLIGAILWQCFFGFAADCREIRQNVLRLHILANSNSEEDQQLKLAVRDAVLTETGELFTSSHSVQDAKKVAEEHLQEICSIAQEEVYRQGYDYTVKATTCKMFFDTRVYENFTLPAGRYEAVRITIGEAEGKNWWCMLYPGLCLPGAMPQEELADQFSEEQVQIITQPQEYEIRFAAVELWEKCKHFLFEKIGKERQNERREEI